jgi:hypothetical protein
MPPIGLVETDRQSPTPTASADCAALGTPLSGRRPDFGFDTERVAERESVEQNSMDDRRRSLTPVEMAHSIGIS